MVTANGYFASCASYVFKQAGDFLYKLGLVGAATGLGSRWAVGYAVIHPGYFVSALLSSVAVKYGADQI